MRKSKSHLASLGTFLIAGGILLAGDSALVEAVKSKNASLSRDLLKQRVDVNAREGDGAVALHWAAHWDDLEIAELLIRAGANPNVANDLGVTPLSLACVNGSAPMVEKLLKSGADANASTSSGETPLMTCARSGSTEAVQFLLAHAANVNAKEHLRDQTALMWAVAERHPEVVRALLEHGADVQARSRTTTRFIVREGEETGARSVCPPGAISDENVEIDRDRIYLSQTKSCADAEMAPQGGSTPLLFAARSGDVESTRLLLAKGANVNEAGADGHSALVVAAHSGNGALAAYLLEAGANPNSNGGGFTALHAAVLRGDLTLVKALLAHGANPSLRLTKGTPVTRDGRDVVLSSGLVGATPFFLAGKFVEPEMMRVFADAGADSKAGIKDGTTPLMAIAGVGWRGGYLRRGPPTLAGTAPPADDDAVLECAKIAIQSGADVNAVNKYGNTALHGAAAKGYSELVQLLADSGANLTLKNKLGQTPLMLATANPEQGKGRHEMKTGELLLRKLLTEKK